MRHRFNIFDVPRYDYKKLSRFINSTEFYVIVLTVITKLFE